jgi:hypothetical protein
MPVEEDYIGVQKAQLDFLLTEAELKHFEAEL